MRWRVAACIGFLILLAGCTASGQDLSMDDARFLAGEQLQQLGQKLANSSSPSSATPIDPVILTVRPALTGQKIGFFDRDTNKQAYYTVTGTDITKAVKVTGDNSFSVTVRGIWRVKMSPALAPDFDWDASGTKVLKIYTLYDDHCCSSKALAAS